MKQLLISVIFKDKFQVRLTLLNDKNKIDERSIYTIYDNIIRGWNLPLVICGAAVREIVQLSGISTLGQNRTSFSATAPTT